jgi:hypothetical protein
LHLEAPTGWHVEPASRHFELGAVDQQTTLAFDVTPPSAEARGNLRAIADINGRKIAANTEFIRYPHIPAQTLFPPAEAALVRAQIQTLAHKIGYITGAGDEVPAARATISAPTTSASTITCRTAERWWSNTTCSKVECSAAIRNSWSTSGRIPSPSAATASRWRKRP